MDLGALEKDRGALGGDVDGSVWIWGDLDGMDRGSYS